MSTTHESLTLSISSPYIFQISVNATRENKQKKPTFKHSLTGYTVTRWYFSISCLYCPFILTTNVTGIRQRCTSKYHFYCSYFVSFLHWSFWYFVMASMIWKRKFSGSDAFNSTFHSKQVWRQLVLTFLLQSTYGEWENLI